MGFLSEKKGIRCEPMQDGTQKCRVYKAAKGQKQATGTEFNVVLDENCDPHFNGPIDVLEDDEGQVKHAIGEMVAQCQKGIRG